MTVTAIKFSNLCEMWIHAQHSIEYVYHSAILIPISWTEKELVDLIVCGLENETILSLDHPRNCQKR